jgi:hypothetical protein
MLTGPPARLFATTTKAFKANGRVIGYRPPGHEHVLLGHVPHASEKFAEAKRWSLD